MPSDIDEAKTNTWGYKSNMPMKMIMGRINSRKILTLLVCVLMGTSALMVMDEGIEARGSSNSRNYETRQNKERSVEAMSGVAFADSLPEFPMDNAEMAPLGKSMMAMGMAEEGMDNNGGGEPSMGGAILDALDSSMNDLEKKGPAFEGRMLVYNGYLSLMAWKGQVLYLADKVEALIKEDSRGYVESRSSYTTGAAEPDHPRREDHRMILDMQLRVASQHFQDVVASIQDLVESNMVVSVSISSNDVTDSYIDATTRADILDASRKALKILLAKANNVNDVMSVQRELNRLTQQYESEKNRAMYLKKQSDYSFLSVHLEEKIPVESQEPRPFWTPSKSVSLAWKHMGSFSVWIADTVVYATLWAVPLLALYLLLLICWKTNHK